MCLTVVNMMIISLLPGGKAQRKTEHKGFRPQIDENIQIRQDKSSMILNRAKIDKVVMPNI